MMEMPGKPKESSSLLFPANVSSAFDDLSSATVILPPSLASTGHLSEDSKQNCDVNVIASTKVLQPHLEGFPIPHEIESSNIELLPPASAPPKNLPDTITGCMRKPTGKYVIPPEINSAPIPPPSVGFSPIPKHPSLMDSSKSPINQFSPLDNSHSVNFPSVPAPSIIPSSFSDLASNPPAQGEIYHPVIHHWFYTEGKPSVVWKPFSFTDSINLEEAFRQGNSGCIQTDGGRFDVNVKERVRMPVFWEAKEGSVMRCSWFRKQYSETFSIPFSEEAAEILEAEFKDAMITGVWNSQVELAKGERVIINSPISIHYYQVPESSEMQHIASVMESQTPLTVRRGADDFDIKDGTTDRVDHLLFLIHGIGSVCDLSFRSVEECVNDFRAMGEELLSIHFKESFEMGKIGRVEILPISWHKALHGDATGLDDKLKNITLRSIPKFREFTNDTLLDILFYTSPIYCQHIMDTVASEMDRLLAFFKERNPSFKGPVSVGGHSLGSVILFDLLMHQTPSSLHQTKESLLSSKASHMSRSGSDQDIPLTSQIDFEIGEAGTGQPAVVYPQLSFRPEAFFLMGSPVGMFITVRGIDKLGPSFHLPTCERVFNIFHPFDPVAYRIETLLDSSFSELRPVLIPHHKGRKRMHLELKDTIERVGYDIKHKIVDSIQATWNKFYQLYSGSAEGTFSQEIDLTFQEHVNQIKASVEESSTPTIQPSIKIGELNRGLRVDYVLQEKPYESLTEYIFALQAHVSYWTSEDTLLMILKELYKIQDIYCDNEVQQANCSPAVMQFPSSHLDSVSEFQSADDNPIPLLSNENTSSPTNYQLPLFSSPPSANLEIQRLKTLRGRPMFDPSKVPKISQLGMDPTALPSRDPVPPPPILPNIDFSQRKGSDI